MLTYLAKDLAQSNIRYCVLHGWQSLPEFLPSDLDIVVHPDDLTSFEGILREEHGRQLIQSFQYETSSFFFVLAAAKADKKCFVQVDAITDYRRNGYIFWSAQELLAGKRWRNGFWVASASTEFGYLLVKKVLKGRLPSHQRKRLEELCEELGNAGLKLSRHLFGQRLGARVISWIRTDKWNIFEMNLRRLKRAMVWQVIRRDPFNSPRFWLAEWKRIVRRYRYPSGLLVAVLGPDGAGKSTLIECLRESLIGAFRRAEVVHVRPGILGGQVTNTPVTDPHGRPTYPLWLSLLKLPYYLLDYGLGYLSKVRPRLVRSTLVLFDRYYHDLLVDPRRYRYGGPTGLARFLRIFIPKPDLFLILDAPEKLLLARKQEVLPEELTRQREAYRKLAMKLPNSVLLDGSLQPKEVAGNAGDAILDYLHVRYLKRRHIWFRTDGSETLNWLGSILFSSKKLRLGPSNVSNDDAQTRWRANDSFGWLSLKDGRGYLIPLASRLAAVKGLGLYNPQTGKAKVAKRVLSAALKRSLSWPLMRRIRTFDRHDVSENEKSEISLFGHLKKIVGNEDLTFAISLGTPGPHRKPVIQILTRDGETLGYVKAGWNQPTNALVRNEADVSRCLSDMSFDSFVVPNVLYADWWGEHFLCIQSGLDGKAQTAPPRLTSQYLAVLKELSTLHVQCTPLEESAFWRNLLRRIENVQSAYYRRILQRGVSSVQESFGAEALPFHFCHGDFAPWNANLLDGRLFLFDWEYADFEAPPAWDLVHFTVQTLQLLEKRTPHEIHKAFLNGGIDHRRIVTHLEALNMKESSVKPLLLLYLLDRLALQGLDDIADFHRRQAVTTMINLCLE